MRVLTAGVATALWALGCSGPGEPPAPSGPLPPPPAAADVDAALFLVGDAGVAEQGRSPLLARLSQEVESWGRSLPAERVAVAFLGDNVYPVGIRPSHERPFPQDSARLWSQVEVLASEAALARGVTGFFVPGNHDWGNMVGQEGVDRLANQERMLDRAREDRGIGVQLVPTGGQPGPVVRDLGSRVRLVFIDTHWLLQARPGDWEPDFFAGIAQALAGAGDRVVIMLAHHPFRSGGPHGALVPALDAMGLLYLFKKSGAFIQDLNSPVYAEFKERLREAFADGGGAPLVFAGGHDHSLQVLSPLTERDPPHLLVSGAGSKLTEVATVPGLRMAVSRPGFMVLYFRKDGGVDLHVYAGSPGDQHCPGGRDEARVGRSACMSESAGRIQPIYGETLRRSGRR